MSCVEDKFDAMGGVVEERSLELAEIPEVLQKAWKAVAWVSGMISAHSTPRRQRTCGASPPEGALALQQGSPSSRWQAVAAVGASVDAPRGASTRAAEHAEQRGEDLHCEAVDLVEAPPRKALAMQQRQCEAELIVSAADIAQRREAALRQARAEGIELELAPGNLSGYKGVRAFGTFEKRFAVRLANGDRKRRTQTAKGRFTVVEEAALEYARARKLNPMPAGATVQPPRQQRWGKVKQKQAGFPTPPPPPPPHHFGSGVPSCVAPSCGENLPAESALV